MPGRDNTGPAGMGPMTGKGAGYCSEYENPGKSGYCRAGFWPGMGRGRETLRMSRIAGRRRNCHALPLSYGQSYDEKTILENQEEVLETRLRNVKNRLKTFD